MIAGSSLSRGGGASRVDGGGGGAVGFWLASLSNRWRPLFATSKSLSGKSSPSRTTSQNPMVLPISAIERLVRASETGSAAILDQSPRNPSASQRPHPGLQVDTNPPVRIFRVRQFVGRNHRRQLQHDRKLSPVFRQPLHRTSVLHLVSLGKLVSSAWCSGIPSAPIPERKEGANSMRSYNAHLRGPGSATRPARWGRRPGGEAASAAAITRVRPGQTNGRATTGIFSARRNGWPGSRGVEDSIVAGRNGDGASASRGKPLCRLMKTMKRKEF